MEKREARGKELANEVDRRVGRLIPSNMVHLLGPIVNGLDRWRTRHASEAIRIADEVEYRG